MKQNLIADMSNVTQITPRIIYKLSEVVRLLICDYINEADLVGDDVISIDIGFGTIEFRLNEDTVTYNFIPSNELENNIVYTLEEKKNPILEVTENNLEKRLFNTYKDLL